jgi:hypothetical protein
MIPAGSGTCQLELLRNCCGTRLTGTPARPASEGATQAQTSTPASHSHNQQDIFFSFFRLLQETRFDLQSHDLRVARR